MRKKLRQIVGEKRFFTATLEKFTAKKGCKKVNVALLSNIKMDGELMADHLWTDRHHFADWMVGGEVLFRGRVAYYKKKHAIERKAIDLTIDSIRVLHCEVAEEQGF